MFEAVDDACIRLIAALTDAVATVLGADAPHEQL
jgi:hypothetical protein